VRCEECRCISEDARDWIAKLIEDDEEPDSESFVVLYCPPRRVGVRAAAAQPLHLTLQLTAAVSRRARAARHGCVKLT
jgi:MoxR-like ATPase